MFTKAEFEMLREATQEFSIKKNKLTATRDLVHGFWSIVEVNGSSNFSNHLKGQFTTLPLLKQAAEIYYNDLDKQVAELNEEKERKKEAAAVKKPTRKIVTPTEEK